MRLATLSMPVLLAAGLLYLGRQCEGQTPNLLDSSVQAADSQLIVRSPVTGVQLDQLTVRTVQLESAEDAPQHPGLTNTDDVLTTDASSPLSLGTVVSKMSDTQCVYYVGSPGYAWKVLGFDPTQAGSREIQLAQGGELSIAFEGAPAEARLRLRPQGQVDGVPSFESKLSTEAPTQIAGLLPATYHASIEMDATGAKPKILAEALVVVRGGRSSEYQMHWPMPRAK
ncbi:MAG: hypothetical protein ACI8QC_003278 [Planctomycetota bacterium]|jgi:hypothetical protein